MPVCKNCGKRGIFLKIDQSGLCKDCARAVEMRRIRIQFLQNQKLKFSKELNSIPLAKVGTDGPRGKLRSLSGFSDLKYSTVTSRAYAASFGDYVAIDLETTGLKATDSILEISAIRFSNFSPECMFSTLINPEKHIPENITLINGITDEMVSTSPNFWEVFPSFQEFVGSSHLVGHNLPFDLKFLFKRGFDVKPNQKLFDTLSISQSYLKKPNSSFSNDWDVYDYKLSTVCEYYNIYADTAHRSSADAFATGLLFSAIVNERAK